MSRQRSMDAVSGFAYWRASAALTASSLREGVQSARAQNLWAGLTVALVALPLNLALALACGLPPSVGLVTGAVAGVIGALVGASKFQITGPEVALAPITLEIVSRHGYDGLIAATFLAGLIQVVLGVLRVGRIVNAIPIPVVGGFMAAVGLLVFDSQVPRLLGLPASVRLLSDVPGLSVLGDVRPSVILLGAGIIGLLVLLPRLDRRIPVQLVGVLLAVAVVAVLGIPAPTIPPIDGAFPAPSMPSFASVDLAALLPEALALALLASIDSLLCAVSIDARTGGAKIRTDQELFAQGVANLGSACFGGMPVAAAVVRSVAAVEAGATTRLAPIVQSVVLGAVLVVLAPFVPHVPVVALAAILLLIGYRLIGFRQLVDLGRVAPFEGAVFLITAGSILVSDFVTGVATGVVAALVHFARQQRLALRPREASGLHAPAASAEGASHAHGVAMARLIRLEGPLFFGSQDRVAEAVSGVEGESDIVMDLSNVTSVDVTGATTLATAIERLAERGTRVTLLVGRQHQALDWVLDRTRQKGVTVTEIPPSTGRAPTRSLPNGAANRNEARPKGAEYAPASESEGDGKEIPHGSRT